MAEKTVAASAAQPGALAPEGTRAHEWYVTPAVDIYETPDELVVLADLPGVSGESVDVRIDNNLLTIQGRSQRIIPGEPVHREYELTHFFRQFELLEPIDQAQVTAELTHGVLTLHLPKAKAAKPRQIAIATVA